MIFLSELVEWIACLTEGGVFYWLAGKTFREERRNVWRYWDCVLTAVLAAVILGLNNIVLYSTFRKTAQSSFSVEVSSIFGLLVILCSLGVYVGCKYLESQNEKMQSRMVKIQNELLQENYQAVSNLYESNARLYHDLNNHLDILYLKICIR